MYYSHLQTIPMLISVSLILNLATIRTSLANAKKPLPDFIRIGAILETGDEKLLATLNQAVDRINRGKILPRSRLEVVAHFVKPNDSFNTAKLACKLVNGQIWAIFSSKSESINWLVRSISKTLHIPHISVYWDYRSKYMENINIQPQSDLRQRSQMSLGGWQQSMRLSDYGIGIPSYRSGRSSRQTNYETNQFQPYETDIYADPNRGNQEYLNSFEEHFTINFYPETTELSQAFMDLIESRNWKSFTIIYDDNNGLIQLKDLLRISNKMNRRRVKISVIRFEDKGRDYLNSDSGQDGHPYHLRQGESSEPNNYAYRKLLKDLKKTEHNLVLSISRDKIYNLLREAYNMKRMSEYDNYLISSLDFHTMDLSEFQDKQVLSNITGLSLLSPNGQPIDLGDSVYRNRPYGHQNQYYQSPQLQAAPYTTLTTTEALIFDAVTLFAQTLDDLDRSVPEQIIEPYLSCNNTQQWAFGGHIMRHMRTLNIKGITGMLKFDNRGHRIDFTLDVLQLKSDGLKNVAKWSNQYGIKSMANYTFFDSYKQVLEAMKYKEFRVTVPPVSEPYIFLREDHHDFVGNEKFIGIGVDLLHEIGAVFRKDFQSDFKFQIKIVADMKYGRPNKETGEWDGMIGELMRHQADLAIADLTATYLRETAVDFTMPFMNLGIAILFKKPSYPDPELFSFLKPFSVQVWLYLASAFLGISLLLWILSRISPYEWVSPHSCDPEPLELENQFSIGNSLWFTIGSLMQQGSDLAPRALSTRTLASVWWFFTLIIISSYTANLAASLTLSRMSPAISNVEDLAKQTMIQYGCKKGGSTHEFFANSNHTIFQRMYNTMESNQEVYINKMEDAIERVRKGGYAYLAESSTIEYLIQRQCDLVQVGTWLDNKGYGIATPTDSPYRTPISNAIVVLQDRGILYELKKRWWIEKGGGRCADDVKVTPELKLENVGGVFVVLVAGVFIGCLSGALEFIWKSLKIARDERESIGKLVWLEIVRICTGGGSSRPVYQAQSSSTNNNTTANNTIGGNSNGGGDDNLDLDSGPLLKSPSFTSVSNNGNLNGMSSPTPYDTYGRPNRYSANSSNFDPLNSHQQQRHHSPAQLYSSPHSSNKNISSPDSTMPLLLSPSSAPSKSLSRINNISTSPNSFKSQQYQMY